MNLLFGIDDNYTQLLLTAIYSISANTDYKGTVNIYVLSKGELANDHIIRELCQKCGFNYYPLHIEEDDFSDAPVSERYPETIYYRLLAHYYLPEDIDKVLYLDADILVINDIEELYNIEIGDNLYAAASHSLPMNITTKVNQFRLQNRDIEAYINSGVILMNLDLIRENVFAEDIYNYIDSYGRYLVLPDQDVLNDLYSEHILEIPDQLYNYHADDNFLYSAKSSGEWDLDWVIENTVILHFCGFNDKEKPWNPKSKSRYASLYKHYQKRVGKLVDTSKLVAVNK